MSRAALSDFMRRLTRQMGAASLSDHSDRQLVEQALDGGPEAVFEAIVQRHGAMVYRVCLRVLQQPQDAEDAFQATFLVLAQKLRAIRKHASLASWLHGVAHRVALRAKVQAKTRRQRESQVADHSKLPKDGTWSEMQGALDAELCSLPEKLRQPLVLCYLEGRTQDEAASQLGWSKSTLRRRLDEARDALGHRLGARGVALSTVMSALLMSDCIASCSPAPALVTSTAEAAANAAGTTVAATASAKVAALTEGVLKTMGLSKFKTFATGLVIALGLVLACCALVRYQTISAREPEKPGLVEKKTAWFEDVTEAVGLDFVHDPGPTGKFLLPQALGSGCAFIHDGDGSLYLYLLQNAGPASKSVNKLYKRMPNGKFKDVTEGSGLGVAGYNMGVAVADVNNDGRPDVLLTQYGGIRLFLNQGNGRYQDATEEAGLKGTFWATSAAFLDYDRDGWLDLVVVAYVDYDSVKEGEAADRKDFPLAKSLKSAASKLFRNVGTGKDGKSGVRFEDVSAVSGIGSIPGRGLGVACADLNGDGWPDIFVANDKQANRLWINQGNGTFKDEAVQRGVAFSAIGQALSNTGVAVGSSRNDGLLDLFVPHRTEEANTLWKQSPRGWFNDNAASAGLTSSRWRGTGFGTVMADFDLDGALDIAVVNGRVQKGGPAKDTDLGFWQPYAEHNQLFANDGAGKFRDLSPVNKAFCDRWNVARGLACDDFNGDGALDLLVTTVGGRARLYRNVAPDRGHWLTIRPVDPKLKRDAYGAEVVVKAGDQKWQRWINPGQSYLSSGPPYAHFGLGKVKTYDSIQVIWPDGTKEEFPGGAVDRFVELRKGK